MSRMTKIIESKMMVDDDPFIVYNDDMRKFASDMFKEAEDKGYTSKEDKARYLSGRLFEMTPFGLHEGIFRKNAIELFNGLISDNREEHYLACIHLAILQRALLESQGIKTRNHMYQITPFSYPFKPVLSPTIEKMNAFAEENLNPLVKRGLLPTFPHATTDIWACKDEKDEKTCKWKTLDSTFDDTTRMLKIRPEPDPKFYIDDKTPATVDYWWKTYVETSPAIKFLAEIGERTPVKEAVRFVFNELWFNPLAEANEHVDNRKKIG